MFASKYIIHVHVFQSVVLVSTLTIMYMKKVIGGGSKSNKASRGTVRLYIKYHSLSIVEDYGIFSNVMS